MKKILAKMDLWLLTITVLYLILGSIMIYSASSILTFLKQDVPSNYYFIRQLLILGVSFLLSLIFLKIPTSKYRYFSSLAMFGILASLIGLYISGKIANGTKGWYDLGFFNMQPAEFAKCIVALAIAKYMGRYEYKLRTWRDLIVPFAMIGVPALIIMILQKETGSALVFAAFLLVFYRQGMSGYVLWIGVAAVALFLMSIRWGQVPLPLGTGSVGILSCMLLLTAVEIYFICKEHRLRWQALILIGSVLLVYGISLLVNIWVAVPFNWVSMGVVIALVLYTIFVSIYWRKYILFIVAAFTVFCIGYTHACDFAFKKVLQPHQRIRIEVLLGMKEDPSGAGYNVNQARIAVGSGRFFGKGYLHGTQTKLQFVPEQDTDFIFCTVGEEWGFVGSIGVLLLYLFFILRLIMIAERQRNVSTRIYAYSVASIFLFHLTINVGMVLGLLPVIGIPLPFFSYGGSSLWGFTLLLFILLRLDAARMEQLR